MCISHNDKFNFKESIWKAKKLEKDALQKNITSANTNNIKRNTSNFNLKKEGPLNLVDKKINNRFLISKLLNASAMGNIYLAKDLSFGETVVLKVLFRESISENDISRFFEEARVASLIKHKNIVRVYDIQKTEKIFFIVMEYIEGKTLEEYITEHGVFSVKDSLKIILQIADGLKVIHDANLVHRDIKPSNLMLTEEAGIKIMDFGIVKDLGKNCGLTTMGTIVGTPQFMAPELITKFSIDTRTDIYSLGATFYYFLTARYCFDGNPVRVMQQVIQKELVPPEEYNSKIPKIISEIILKMMRKKPEDRLQNIDDVIQIVGGYLDVL